MRWESANAFRLDCLTKIIEIRAVEQRVVDLSNATPPAIPGSIHPCAGQEAVPVAAVAGLQDRDQLIATYRGHGWALASGLSIVEVVGEICQRSVGINGGRGGSAYMMAPWTRFIGENSIVGAGIPMACGVALANEFSGNQQVVVVSVGDGAFNQGSAHEGLAFAAARELPVIIICENNQWSELTPTSETFKIKHIAQRSAGYGIPGETIDGTDPIVIRDTVKRAADRARSGEGPTVIECLVPRLWGHYNRDIEHYRSMEDRRAAGERDPILLLSHALIADGAIDQQGVDDLIAEVRSKVEKATAVVLDSAPPDPDSAGQNIWAVHSVSSTTSAPSERREMSYIQAVNAALSLELENRPEVIVYGEDVGRAGGIFGASRGLQKIYGEDRVFDTPIAESAILGSAVGAALIGMKPVVEIMWADFLLVALDQLINQAANIRYITGGRSGVPMVVRTQQGATPGSCAQHSQCLEALLAHIPGLRVAVPATPQDAYDILRSAVADPDPCVIFEARSLYQSTGVVELSDTIHSIGKASLKKAGANGVIVTWGTMVPVALQAVQRLKETGLEIAVLDLRWLSPLDDTAIRKAVLQARGRVVVAHEANLTGGFGAEVVTRIHEMLGEELPLTIKRVGTPDVRMPAAPNLSRTLLPNVDRIILAMRAVIEAHSPKLETVDAR